jgi:hypothetical protein
MIISTVRAVFVTQCEIESAIGEFTRQTKRAMLRQTRREPMRKLEKILVISALVFAATVATATPGNTADVVIERVNTNTVMHVGQRYWVDISVKTTTDVVITEACFIWSGAGPFCFPVVHIQKNKKIRVSIIARQPRKYDVQVFVKYNSGGKVYDSNRVNLNVHVEG